MTTHLVEIYNVGNCLGIVWGLSRDFAWIILGFLMIFCGLSVFFLRILRGFSGNCICYVEAFGGDI